MVPIPQGRMRGMFWAPASGGKILRVLLGSYEREQTELFAKLVGPGSTVLDIGAHVGYYTLLAARLMRGQGKVVAFEPDPKNAAFLRRHVSANRAARTIVDVEQAAVGATNGSVRFSLGTGSGTGHVSAEGPIEVRMIKLDDFVSGPGAQADPRQNRRGRSGTRRPPRRPGDVAPASAGALPLDARSRTTRRMLPAVGRTRLQARADSRRGRSKHFGAFVPATGMKIAVFLPNWLGDLVMATPTLRAMRRHFGPQARLVGILRPYLADVLAGTGWLDEQWFFDPRAKDRGLHALGRGAAHAAEAVRHGRAAAQLAPHGAGGVAGRSARADRLRRATAAARC